MADVRVPVKIINGVKWADLSKDYPQATHFICGTECRDSPDISLYHNHGLRVRKFKQNVHWRVATGFVELDITNIALPQSAPAQPQHGGQRHNKGRR
jgi:hypothetical protein